MQGKYCYGVYYDKQCCSPGQLPIGNNKEASLAQDVGVAPRPPPPGLRGTPYKSPYGDALPERGTVCETFIYFN